MLTRHAARGRFRKIDETYNRKYQPLQSLRAPETAQGRRAGQPGSPPLRLALFEPDIPQNCGAMLRLAACMGIAVDIVEPCGFLLDDRRLRRAGMDYLARVAMRRHASWEHFLEAQRRRGGRLLLLTSRADLVYTEARYDRDDTLLVGRESAGAPEAVHCAADLRLRIPMTAGARSLNVALAAAMALGEALRQTGGFPEE